MRELRQWLYTSVVAVSHPDVSMIAEHGDIGMLFSGG
jgi:hypothetical protein